MVRHALVGAVVFDVGFLVSSLSVVALLIQRLIPSVVADETS